MARKHLVYLQKHLGQYLRIAGCIVALAVIGFIVWRFDQNTEESKRASHVSQVAEKRANQVRPMLTPFGLAAGSPKAAVCGVNDPAIDYFDCTVEVVTDYAKGVHITDGMILAGLLDTLDAKMKQAGWNIAQNDFRIGSPNSRAQWAAWFTKDKLEVAYEATDGAARCNIAFTLGRDSSPPIPYDTMHSFFCSEAKQ